MSKVFGLVVGLSLVMAFGAVDGVDAKKKKKSNTKVFDPQELCDRQYASGLEFKKNARLNDAKEAFVGTIEACPDFRKAFVQLGNISRQLKEYDDAIVHYEKALALDGNDPEVTEALAYTYSLSGELDKAEDIYIRLLEDDPGRMGAVQNLAYTYEQQNKDSEAFMLYSRAYQVDTSMTSLEEKLANLALGLKQYEQAYIYTKKQVDRDPEKLDLREKMAYFHYRMQDWDGAIERYQVLVDETVGQEGGLNRRGILAYCLKNAERIEEAFPHYDFIIANDTNPKENTFRLYGNALMDFGQFEKAISVGKKGLSVNPKWECVQYMIAEAHSKKGETLQGAKKWDSARASFKQAKSEFAKVTAGDCASNASAQLKRQDQLVDRLNKMQEKAGSTPGTD